MPQSWPQAKAFLSDRQNMRQRKIRESFGLTTRVLSTLGLEAQRRHIPERRREPESRQEGTCANTSAAQRAWRRVVRHKRKDPACDVMFWKNSKKEQLRNVRREPYWHCICKPLNAQSLSLANGQIASMN